MCCSFEYESFVCDAMREPICDAFKEVSLQQILGQRVLHKMTACLVLVSTLLLPERYAIASLQNLCFHQPRSAQKATLLRSFGISLGSGGRLHMDGDYGSLLINILRVSQACHEHTLHAVMPIVVLDV